MDNKEPSKSIEDQLRYAVYNDHAACIRHLICDLRADVDTLSDKYIGASMLMEACHPHRLKGKKTI
jgi:hypothetical protein